MDDEKTRPVDVRALLARGRAAGHDALGIANDPEAWQTTADLARDRFARTRAADDLRVWVDFTAELAAIDWLAPAVVAWVGDQLTLISICGIHRATRLRLAMASRAAPDPFDAADDVSDAFDGLARGIAAFEATHPAAFGAARLRIAAALGLDPTTATAVL